MGSDNNRAKNKMKFFLSFSRFLIMKSLIRFGCQLAKTMHRDPALRGGKQGKGIQSDSQFKVVIRYYVKRLRWSTAFEGKHLT